MNQIRHNNIPQMRIRSVNCIKVKQFIIPDAVVSLCECAHENCHDNNQGNTQYIRRFVTQQFRFVHYPSSSFTLFCSSFTAVTLS